MSSPYFGLDPKTGKSLLDNKDAVLNRVLTESKPMSRLNAKQVLREAYHQTFGIFDHFTQAAIEASSKNPDVKRPLASVALHPAESLENNINELDVILRGFAINEVGRLFNISLMDFLNLPPYECSRLIKISQEILGKKAQAEKEISAQLQTDMKNVR